MRFDHVCKNFGDNRVLRDLSLDVRPGERLAVIGPSGSGKSTILRMLMTLEAPTSGAVYVDGAPVWPEAGLRTRQDKLRQRLIRAKVGFVFQHFNLFPHMTALENVSVAPRTVMGLSKGDARQRAMEHLDMVGMSQKSDAYPGQLSGGQQQRVAIARALATSPAIMLLDEITSALDPELVGEVLNVVRTVAQNTSTTMLIVTHEMSFAREVADRVAFFDQGAVVEIGQPQTVLSDPREERTRTFLKAVLSH
nr:amino acid ABC transporter ATP-binding protein [Mycobacterium aquaticum]